MTNIETLYKMFYVVSSELVILLLQAILYHIVSSAIETHTCTIENHTTDNNGFGYHFIYELFLTADL